MRLRARLYRQIIQKNSKQTCGRWVTNRFYGKHPRQVGPDQGLSPLLSVCNKIETPS